MLVCLGMGPCLKKAKLGFRAFGLNFKRSFRIMEISVVVYFCDGLFLIGLMLCF